MHMRTVRLVDLSWLSIQPRQAFVRSSPRDRSNTPSNDEPRPLPLLDWPSTLFENEIPGF